MGARLRAAIRALPSGLGVPELKFVLGEFVADLPDSVASVL